LPPNCHGQHHQHQCRQQPSCAANPEVGQVNTAAAAQFVKQQRRDQESAEHEKHVDTDESARHPGNAAVAGEHQRDRQRSHAVQRADTRTVIRPARGQPVGRRRRDPSRPPSTVNRRGVCPGRFHGHLSTAPTDYPVGGFVAADTSVPLPVLMQALV
jgi:hypothetical protein